MLFRVREVFVKECREGPRSSPEPFFDAYACKHACARVQNALPAGWEHDHRNAELGTLTLHLECREGSRPSF